MTPRDRALLYSPPIAGLLYFAAAYLNAARHKHGASRIKAARVLLGEARDLSGRFRATRIRAALAALKGLK